MASSSSDCPSLPDDLVEEILCRVPTESLTRFKLTCKRWLSLFTDKRFMYKQLAFVQQQFLEIRDSVQIIDHEKQPSISIPLPLDLESGRYFKVRAHCDGLLLCDFEARPGKLAIWNPYLGQVRLTCPLNFMLMLPDCCCGLGYKHASREDGYQILRFHTGNEGIYNPYAEIYDFKYMTWTSLDFSWDWYVFKPYRGVSLNGNVYWIAAWNHDSKVFIQSFDFSVEKFEPLCSLPSTCVGSTFMALSDFRRDKLSLLQEREETIDIWVTSKIKKGVVISWTKLFRLSVPRPNLPAMHATSHYVIISPPVYFVDKNNRIIVCSEEQDGSYVCANLYVIGEDGFENSI